MSKVFIGWSGNLELAKQVAQKIHGTDPNYECIIGGNAQGMEEIFIGDTIIKQMLQCDQAILLVQKKDDGTISSNMMFEWGFLLGELNPKKVHRYFINIDANDPLLPSDVQGIWANEIFSTEKTTVDQMLQAICDDFFKRQRISIEGNKITTILKWYKTKSIIANHPTRPEFSDFELAQYVFLYVYSGKFFENIFNTVEEDLGSLAHALPQLDRQCELGVILRTARQSLLFLKSVKTYDLPNGSQAAYLALDDYEEFSDIFRLSMRNIDRFEDNEPKLLFKILLRNFIVYMNLLVLSHPIISDEDRNRYADLVMRHCNKLIEECAELENINSRDNKQFCWLMLSYTYRSMYCAVLELEKFGLVDQSTDSARQAHEANKEELLRAALENRYKLYSYYRGENVNGEFFDMLEMEYFLSLAEYLKYEDDEDERLAASHKLNRYVTKSQKISRIKRICIDIIVQHLKDADI